MRFHLKYLMFVCLSFISTKSIFSQSIVFNNLYDYGTNYEESVHSINELPNGNGFIALSNYYEQFNLYNKGYTRIFEIDQYGNKTKDVYYKIQHGGNVGTSTIIENEFIYVLGACADSSENYNFDTYLLKLNKNLDSIYSKIIDIGYYDAGDKLIRISNNRLVFISYYYADSTILENSQVVMVTIDTLGNVVDKWEWGGSGYDFAYDYKLTADGGYVIAGKTNDFVGDDFDFFIRKIDSAGVTEWYHEYGTPNNENIRTLNYIELTADGGYLLTGDESLYTTEINHIAILLKVDSLGIQEWRKEFSAIAKSTIAASVRIQKDETILLVGGTSDINLNPPFNDPRGYLKKLNSTGEEIWNRYFSKFWNANDDYVYDMILTSDGGVLVSGYVIAVQTTGNDPWLVKFDSCGYTVGDIPEPMLIIDSVIRTKENSTVYITDQSTNYCTAELDWGDGSELESYYAYENNMPLVEKQFSHTYTQTGDIIIKTTALAGEEFRDYEVFVLGLSSDDNSSKQKAISLFPNPANEFVIVQNSENGSNKPNKFPFREECCDYKANIFDLNGKQVKTINLNPKLYQQKIEIASLTNGVYFVKFMLGNDMIGAEKLVVAR